MQLSFRRIIASQALFGEREIVVGDGIGGICMKELSEVRSRGYGIAGLQRDDAARVERARRIRIEGDVAIGNRARFTDDRRVRDRRRRGSP